VVSGAMRLAPTPGRDHSRSVGECIEGARVTMVDTRLSFALSHWMTTLYVNNVTNNLGITSIQDPAIFGNRAQAIVFAAENVV